MRMNSCWRFYFVMMLICCLHLHIKNKRKPVSFVCSENIVTQNKSAFKTDESSSGNNKENLLSGVYLDSALDNPVYLPTNVSSKGNSRKFSNSVPVNILDYSDSVLATVLTIFLKCLQENNKFNGQRRTLHNKIADLKACCVKNVPENLLNRIFSDVAKMLNTYMADIGKESTGNEKTADRNERFQNVPNEESEIADIRSVTNKSTYKTSDDEDLSDISSLSDISRLSYLLQKNGGEGTFTPEEEIEKKKESIKKSGLSSLWEKGSYWNNYSGDEQNKDNKNRRPNRRPGYGTQDMSKVYGCKSSSDMRLIYDRKPFGSENRGKSGLQPRNMFFYYLLECSASNMGSGDSTIQCLKQRLRKHRASMSDRCLDCFKKSVECGKSNCLWSCMFGSPCSESCFNCGVKNCKRLLVQCTGLSNLPDACS